MTTMTTTTEFEARTNGDGTWAPVHAWTVVSPWGRPDGVPEPLHDTSKAVRSDTFCVRTPSEALDAYARMRAQLPLWGLGDPIRVIPDAMVYTCQVRADLSEADAARFGWRRDGAEWSALP